MTGAIFNFSGKVSRRLRSYAGYIVALSYLIARKKEADFGGKPITLLFFPGAVVSSHFKVMTLLARIMAAFGNQVAFVRCFGAYKRCVAMMTENLPFEAGAVQRNSFCLSCLASSLNLLKDQGFNTIDFSDYISEEDHSQIRELLQDLPVDMRDFSYDDILFGRIAMADLGLVTKATLDENVNENIRDKWKDSIQSTLLSYFIIHKIIKKHNVARIFYFGDYSINIVIRIVAERLNIDCMTICLASYKNADPKKYLFYRAYTRGVFFQMREQWPKWREVPLSRKRVVEMTDDILYRIGGIGSHIYSPAKTLKDIRTELGLATDKKILVAYTGSADEVVANFATSAAVGHEIPIVKQPFGTCLEDFQISWIRELVQFAKNSDDIELIVRIHPREGAVKGEKTVSQRLAALKQEFDRPLPNCHFIWPEDKVSSFDLGEIADLALVTWSTIGIEMARLGVPVLTATYGISSFPNELFHEFSESKEGYFAKLRALLGRGPCMDAVKLVYRWANLHYLGCSIDVGDVVLDDTLNPQYADALPAESSVINQIMQGNANVLDVNNERLRNACGPHSNEEEHETIREQIRRLVYFFCFGQEAYDGSPLFCFALNAAITDQQMVEQARHFDKDAIVLFHLKNQVWFVRNGILATRYSPLITRLAIMGAQRLLNYGEISEPGGSHGAREPGPYSLLAQCGPL